MWPYNTATWHALREKKLAQDPVCQICGEYQKLEVHHYNPITPIQREKQDKKAAFPSLNKLQVLCETCHSLLTTTGHHTEAQIKAQWDALIDIDEGKNDDSNTEIETANEHGQRAFNFSG